MQTERIRCARLRGKVMMADEAAMLIKDGMTVGMSGFGYAGDCKSVPFALARRAADEAVRITLITGASLGHDIDKTLAAANVTARRMPFQFEINLNMTARGGPRELRAAGRCSGGRRSAASAHQAAADSRGCRRSG